MRFLVCTVIATLVLVRVQSHAVKERLGRWWDWIGAERSFQRALVINRITRKRTGTTAP
jgi:hypothetical protein